jgi:hypothetical protein
MSRDKQIEEMAQYYVLRNKDTGMYFRGKGVNRWGKYFNQATIYRVKGTAEASVREVSWHGEKAEIVPIQIFENDAGYRKASDLAEEIFAEIEKILNRIYNTYVFEDNDYSDDDVAIECAVNYGTEVAINIAELKKKYTQEK